MNRRAHVDPEESVDELPATPPEAAEPAAPPKPELRIRDLGRKSRPRGCSVCGKPNPPHVEIEVDGVLEYTCVECYEGKVIEVTACRSCGTAMEAPDNFCGKCGTPRLMKCPSCGAAADEEDRFCGKCGARLS